MLDFRHFSKDSGPSTYPLFLPTLFLLLSGILLTSTEVRAQITVDSVIAHFSASERPVRNVIVGNSSDSPAYVKVEVTEVPEPEKSEKTAPTTELLASPKAFSIEPNGQRTVRLLLKTPPTDRERVYRVSFIPQDRGFGDEIAQSQDGIKTFIKVLTGMGMLVFADPRNPVEDLHWERTSSKVVFTNTGNVNVFLGDGESCTPAGVCAKLPSKRLYSTNSFEFAVPPENTVSIMSRAGGSGRYQRIEIPAGPGSKQSLISQNPTPTNVPR